MAELDFPESDTWDPLLKQWTGEPREGRQGDVPMGTLSGSGGPEGCLGCDAAPLWSRVHVRVTSRRGHITEGPLDLLSSWGEGGRGRPHLPVPDAPSLGLQPGSCPETEVSDPKARVKLPEVNSWLGRQNFPAKGKNMAGGADVPSEVEHPPPGVHTRTPYPRTLPLVHRNGGWSLHTRGEGGHPGLEWDILLLTHRTLLSMA